MTAWATKTAWGRSAAISSVVTAATSQWCLDSCCACVLTAKGGQVVWDNYEWDASADYIFMR